MQKFPKIETILKRDKGDFKVTPIIRQDDGILALRDMTHIIIEEKIDGTNGHIEYTNNAWGEWIDYYSRRNRIEDCSICKGGKEKTTLLTNPPKEKICPICKGKGYKDIMFIRETLEKVININLLRKWYKENFKQDEDGASITIKIFGEVFGDKINKGLKYVGKKNYRNFRVFDIQIGNAWLSPKGRNEICNKLELRTVPKIATLIRFPTYEKCYRMLYNTDSKSLIAQENNKDSFLEGYILRPQISLYVNYHKRVIGKIKRKDF